MNMVDVTSSCIKRYLYIYNCTWGWFTNIINQLIINCSTWRDIHDIQHCLPIACKQLYDYCVWWYQDLLFSSAWFWYRIHREENTMVCQWWSLSSYSLIAFDEKVTFWLNAHVPATAFACVFAALFACALALWLYVSLRANKAIYIHAQDSGRAR